LGVLGGINLCLQILDALILIHHDSSKFNCYGMLWLYSV
jgi:hypothetical protein